MMGHLQEVHEEWQLTSVARFADVRLRHRINSHKFWLVVIQIVNVQELLRLVI
jgi:hypothetical protein